MHYLSCTRFISSTWEKPVWGRELLPKFWSNTIKTGGAECSTLHSHYWKSHTRFPDCWIFLLCMIIFLMLYIFLYRIRWMQGTYWSNRDKCYYSFISLALLKQKSMRLQNSYLCHSNAAHTSVMSWIMVLLWRLVM